MAVGTDPLQRDKLGIVSQDTGDRLAAPKNPVFQLAQALGDIAPEAAQLGVSVGHQLEKEAHANARRDAIIAAGAPLADAVRAGKLSPTQNPFYIQAYQRESSAIRTTTALRALQTDSASWAEKNDPAAFEKRWREEVSKVGESYQENDDQAAGFVAAEDQFTPAILQSNQAQNSSRIQLERTQNLSALAANAVSEVTKRNGGTITPAQALVALAPAKAQWLQTGGSEEDWNKIALGAIVTAADATQNAGLLDLTKALGPDGKPTGDPHTAYGSGPTTAPATPPVYQLPPGTPPGSAPTLVVPTGPARLDRMVSITLGSEGGGTLAHPKVSLRGAKGPMQVMPGTDTNPGFGVKPMQANTEAERARVGRDYLHAMLNRYNGNPGKAWAAYNWGPGNVDGVVAQYGDKWADHLPSETRAYVRKNIAALGTSTASTGDQPTGKSTADAGGAPIAAGPIAPPAAETAQAPTAAESKARAPGLYDMAGVAQDVEQNRYRISQSVKDVALDRLRTIQANRTLGGLAVEQAVYAKYGTSVLTGNVDIKAVVEELSKAGYSTEAIASGLNQIRNAVGDSAGILQAQHTINSSDGEKAKRVFDLAAKGRRDGYSPEYEAEVGREVLAGTITTEDGVGMIGGARAQSQYVETQARQAKSEARAEDHFQRQQHLLTQPVRNFGELKDQGDVFVEFMLHTAQTRLGAKYRYVDGVRKTLQGQMRANMKSYLAVHPGDWDGAVNAGNAYAESYLRNVQQAHQRRVQAQQPPKPPKPAVTFRTTYDSRTAGRPQ